MGLLYNNAGALLDIPNLVPCPDPIAGRWYAAGLSTSTANIATYALSNTSAACVPFIVRQKCTIGKLGIYTAATGVSFQLAIYASSSTGELTGNPLTTVVFQNSTAGVLSATITSPVQLNPGIYWFVLSASANVSNSMYGINSSEVMAMAKLFGSTTQSSVASGLAYSLTMTYGNFPNNAGAIQSGSIYTPCIQYYIQSVP